MNQRSKKLIYDSLIRSHILYGIELWGINKGTGMRKLEIMQKKALRIIDNKVHTEPIMKKYKILRIKDEYNMALKLLAWSMIRNLAPLSIKKDYNWVIGQREGMRNHTRVEELLYRSNSLKNQLYQNLAKKINEQNEIYQNYSKVRYRNTMKKEIILTYNEIIRCNNINCRDCTAGN